MNLDNIQASVSTQTNLTVKKTISGNGSNKAVNTEFTPPNSQNQKRIGEKELISAIESANKSIKVYDRKLEFSIHEKTKAIIVKVIDTSSDSVIREIPAEKTLDMVAKFMEMSGLLVDEKA